MNRKAARKTLLDICVLVVVGFIFCIYVLYESFKENLTRRIRAKMTTPKTPLDTYVYLVVYIIASVLVAGVFFLLINIHIVVGFVFLLLLFMWLAIGIDVVDLVVALLIRKIGAKK